MTFQELISEHQYDDPEENTQYCLNLDFLQDYKEHCHPLIDSADFYED